MKKLAFILALLASNGAVAQDQKTIRAYNNLQDEMTTCMVFYIVGQTCMKGRESPEIAQKTAATIDALTVGSFKIGEALGMTEDAMSSRLKMRAAEMRRLMNDDCINFSSLLSRYSDRCPRVIQNPGSILAEYMR